MPAAERAERARPKAFVMMPFASEFDDVYDIIRQAVAAVDDDITSVRLDEVRSAGRVTDDLVSEIDTAAICIADVTGANPNVMWEVGFAAALRKPIIALNQSGVALPFDIADVRTVMYDRATLSKSLREPLSEALRQTLRRYSVIRIAPHTAASRPRVIAVTGSMQSLPDRAAARLRRAISPYLGRGFAWYVGSFGLVDELVVQLLVGAGEKSIAVVGYSAYDLSGVMLSLLDSHPGLEFLDASEEQVAASSGAPSDRDAFLAARSDLLIVCWNGVSPRTQRLLDWLAATRKDHLRCFIPPVAESMH